MSFDLVDRVRRSDDGEALRMLYTEKASRTRMLPAVQARIRARAALLVPPPKPKPVEASPPPPKPDPITQQAEILKANWQAQSAGDFYAEAWLTLSKIVTIDHIKRDVCQYFNVTREDMESARRTFAIVRPRQIAMYLSKRLTHRSLPEIGRRFGQRDHTTVLAAIHRIEHILETRCEPAIAAATIALRESLEPR